MPIGKNSYGKFLNLPNTLVVCVVLLVAGYLGSFYLNSRSPGDKNLNGEELAMPTSAAEKKSSEDEGTVSEKPRYVYRNYKHYFSFTYNNDTEVLECPGGSIYIVKVARSSDPCISGADSFSISMIPDSEAERLEADFIAAGYDVTVSPMEIGGTRGTLYILDRTDAGLTTLPQTTSAILIKYNNLNYYLNRADGVDDILESFRFYEKRLIPDTSRWKTFESVYGYSVRYPDGWLVATGEPKPGPGGTRVTEEVVFSFDEPNQPSHGGFPYGMSVSLKIPEDGPGDKPISEWAVSRYSPEKPVQVADETVAGIKSARINSYFEGTGRTIFIPRDGKVYTIASHSFTTDDTDPGQTYKNVYDYEQVFQEIVKSFRFADNAEE